jgi:membrane-bound metal-dependent hydrolase YbcI (DUF457 family)
LHTAAGAALLAAVASGVVVAVARRRGARSGWPVGAVVATALFATWSHVALDGVMHADAEPLWPWTGSNPLLGLLGRGALHGVCVGLGLAGGAALLWERSRRPPGG